MTSEPEDLELRAILQEAHHDDDLPIGIDTAAGLQDVHRRAAAQEMPVKRDPEPRSLGLLIGIVAFAALLLVSWAAVDVHYEPGAVLRAAVLTCLVAASSNLRVTFRLRSTALDLHVARQAVVVVAIAFVSPSWVALIAAAGVSIYQLAWRRRVLLKVSFIVAKEVVAAGAGALAASVAGLTPVLESDNDVSLGTIIPGVAAGLVAYALVDELVSQALFAIVTRTPYRQMPLAHWNALTISRIGSFGVAIATVAAYRISHWLVLVLPPLVYAIHLASASRVRARQGNEAWQRIAEATDEFNTVDLTAVLYAAVRRAAYLFSTDAVEVQIRPQNGEARLVRSNGREILYDGHQIDAPAVEGFVIPIALESYRGDADLGELRLRFRGPVKLTEREGYTLRTFAAALCTAIRNAATFAEMQRLAESHARAAAQDPLTQLANRRRLQQYGDEIAAGSSREFDVAMLLIDLDNFKGVNDTLGHTAGDQVLVTVAERLTSAMGPRDLVARFGGDEFAILLTGLDGVDATVHRAEAIVHALDAPIEVADVRISVTASCGVASATGTRSTGELLRRADVALYHAKAEGRRVVMFTGDHDTADVGALTLAGDLARAVAEHRLTLRFEPIVDLATGAAVGAEAQTVWRHPDRGDLPNSAFMRIVERSPFLAAVTTDLLDQAIAAALVLREAGFAIPVAVNLPATTLLDTRLPEWIRAALGTHGVGASGLIIEVAESVLSNEVQGMDEGLRALHGIGVGLALNDFGNGRSSLIKLAQSPVSTIKIHCGQISAVESSGAPSILKSVVELGRNHGIDVTAMGVESEGQRSALWRIGCSAGQGGVFARGGSIAELLVSLRSGWDGVPGVLARPLHEGRPVSRLADGRRRVSGVPPSTSSEDPTGDETGRSHSA